MIGPHLKRLLFSTLRRQLILGVAVVHAVLVVLFIADLTHRQQRLVLERQTEHAQALAHSLATSSAGWIASRDVSGLQEIIATQSKYPDLAFAMILDEDGRVLAHTDASRLGLYLGDLPARPVATVLLRSVDLVDVAVPSQIGTRHVGWARVGINPRLAREALNRLVFNGAAYAFGAIVLGSTLAWVVGSLFTRRLQALQSTMDSVHGGDIHSRAVVSGHDEVATLARDFNQMLDTLEEEALRREQVRKELRESTQFLDTIIRSLPLMVFVKEAEHLRFLVLNKAGETLLGYPAEELLGKGDAEIFPPEQAEGFMAKDREVLHGNVVVDIPEEQILTRSGELRTLHTLKVPILDELGQPKFLLGISQDITDARRMEEDRRRMESELHRIQRMESLGSLAGGVAHDMNNVIGAIMALASIHLEKETSDDRLHRDMDTIVTACLRARTLVRGLLGFARQELAESTVVDLNTLVREEVALLERTTLGRIRMVMDLEQPLQPVEGDPAALSHALMNLCVNAVDAMPDGGTLTLGTRNAPDGRVRLEVTDTGTGMSPEVLERALEPFFSTKPQGKGTGLGLAIVYGTVKAHHGTVELHSTPGVGTQVVLWLPACTYQALEAAPGEAIPAVPRPLRVLVVDDDELIRFSTASLLEAMHHTPTAVGSGEEALELLHGKADFDTVILDLNMPGLGGEGTLPQLRALHPDLPVFLATGRADQHAVDLCRTFKGVTLLAKPFSLEELAAHFRALG
ncbi:MAG TPA: ATP-binding protein [Holophagaceae bacterium]|nr:ATP-binding protein [Holophagaceae bacterium]